MEFEPITPAQADSNIYAEHIAQLCDENRIEHKIRVNYDRATAWRYDDGGDMKGRIAMRKITGGVSYLIALHEIGHILCEEYGKFRLEKEGNAWEWALDNIKLPVKPVHWRRALVRLDSYVRWAERNHRAVWPDRDHKFWTIRERMEALGNAGD